MTDKQTNKKRLCLLGGPRTEEEKQPKPRNETNEMGGSILKGKVGTQMK